jgi:hypothetical protein
MKKFSLRVNGTRVGDAARPAESSADVSVQATHGIATARMPTRRALTPMRVNASLLVRDYRDGTDDA